MPGALISTCLRPVAASASAALAERGEVRRRLHLTRRGVEQLGRERGDAGKAQARKRVEGVGDGEDVGRGIAALVAAIERVARRDDARQSRLAAPAPALAALASCAFSGPNRVQ